MAKFSLFTCRLKDRAIQPGYLRRSTAQRFAVSRGLYRNLTAGGVSEKKKRVTGPGTNKAYLNDAEGDELGTDIEAGSENDDTYEPRQDGDERQHRQPVPAILVDIVCEQIRKEK